MKKIFISVLTPIYNHDVEYVRLCLESLKSQTLQNMEMILIDNEATSEAKQLIAEYAQQDKRFKVIHIDHNIGYGPAMNEGIEAARGQYIGIVESDDWIEPNMYSRLSKYARKYGADIVKCRFEHYMGNGSYNPSLKYELSLCNRILTHQETECIPLGPASQWCGIYKKQLLDQYAIRYTLLNGAFHQDMGFVLKTWCCAKSLVLCNDVLYHYRLNNSNSSTYQQDVVAWGSHKEYVLLREFVQKTCPEQRYWEIINRREYLNKLYFFNQRLHHRRLFYLLTAMSNVFKHDLQQEQTDEKLYSPDEWKEYNEIAYHPYMYYFKYLVKKYLFSQEKTDKKRIFHVCGIKLVSKRHKSRQRKLNELTDSVNKLLRMQIDSRNQLIAQRSYLQASVLHPNVFSKYKNLYHNRTVALICTGPSAKFIPNLFPSDTIFVGVNGACRLKQFPLNFLFMQDNTVNQLGNETLTDEAVRYEGNQCIKFFATFSSLTLTRNLNAKKPLLPIPSAYSYYPRVHRYIVNDDASCIFPAIDISAEPFTNMFGTAFSAMQFICYTNPARIYLIGCDCTSGYAYKDTSYIELFSHVQYWKRIREFAMLQYPDTEIISINPVGLKGLFKDVYTESYLKEHPEIQDVEILK